MRARSTNHPVYLRGYDDADLFISLSLRSLVFSLRSEKKKGWRTVGEIVPTHETFFTNRERLWQLGVGSCARSRLPHPLGMDDALNEGPLLALKRGPEESLREVKLARRGIPQDSRREVSHELARTEELAPGDTADKLAHDIRRAMSVTARWMFTVPPRVWLAVSHTHMVAQIYWQTELHVNQCGYVKPSPLVVVKRLAYWLRPVLPDVAPEVIHRCLTLTRLQCVIEAYVALLLRAKLLGLHFSNDVATEQRFDRAIHLKMIDIPLHAGGLCIVVFPGITIRAAAFESPRVLSKGFVVPLQPPEELDSLRQELR